MCRHVPVPKRFALSQLADWRRRTVRHVVLLTEPVLGLQTPVQSAAFEQLQVALAHDFNDVDLLGKDADFARVRRDPEFIAVVKRLETNARSRSGIYVQAR